VFERVIAISKVQGCSILLILFQNLYFFKICLVNIGLYIAVYVFDLVHLRSTLHKHCRLTEGC